MTITIESELEERLRDVAATLGQEPDGYIRSALMRQVAADERRAKEDWLRREFEAAASDPLFLQDNAEIAEAFLT